MERDHMSIRGIGTPGLFKRTQDRLIRNPFFLVPPSFANHTHYVLYIVPDKMRSAPHVSFLVDSASPRSSLSSDYASDSSDDSLPLTAEPKIKLHPLLTRSPERIYNHFNYHIFWDICDEPRYAQYVETLDTHEHLRADDWNASATEPAVQSLRIRYSMQENYELIVKAQTNTGVTIAEIFMALYDHFRRPSKGDESKGKNSLRMEIALDKRTANVDRSNKAPRTTGLSKGDEMMKFTRFAGMDVEPGKKYTVRLTLKGRDSF